MPSLQRSYGPQVPLVQAQDCPGGRSVREDDEGSVRQAEPEVRVRPVQLDALADVVRTQLRELVRALRNVLTERTSGIVTEAPADQVVELRQHQRTEQERPRIPG